MYVCMYSMCMPAFRGQKSVLDPLELKLWVVGSHLCVLSTKLGSTARAVSALDP